MLQGKSFSIGGDAGANTITNWLRNYNEDIIGMSVGSHFTEVCGCLCCNLPLVIQKERFSKANEVGVCTVLCYLHKV